MASDQADELTPRYLLASAALRCAWRRPRAANVTGSLASAEEQRRLQRSDRFAAAVKARIGDRHRMRLLSHRGRSLRTRSGCFNVPWEAPVVAAELSRASSDSQR